MTENTLRNLYDIGYNLLAESSQPTTVRTFYLEGVTRKAIGIAETLLMLIKVRGSAIEYVQENMTITSLARNMIDLCRMMNYFIEPGMSMAERNFREDCWSYHSTQTLFNITDKLNDYDLSYRDFSGSMHLLFYQRDLTENAIFKTLDKGDRKAILNGKKYILSKRITSRISPISINVEQGIYDLFSNQVHSLPISNDPFKIDSLYSGNVIVELSLKVFNLYLSILILNYARTRRLIRKALTADEKDYLVRISKDSSQITDWIEGQMRYLED
ncbi:hypothetical protein IGI66_002899 [Enterococcus sp. AZ048]|uniref:hypothetical protein n=1 Tax=Enterococcus sp. AZ048 TaxID=2774658 RepID=UPI003F220A2D